MSCPTCGWPTTPRWPCVRCHPGSRPVRVSLPQPALGELFGRHGRPWARLHDERGHGLVYGWRSTYTMGGRR